MIIEQSENFIDVVKSGINPILQARLDMARWRLEFDIAYELSKVGMYAPTANDIKRIIDGLPVDVLCRELAART